MDPSSVRTDATVRTATVLAVAWIVVFAAASLAVPDNTLVGGFVYLVPWLAAAVLTVRAARTVTGPRRAFWRLMALSTVVWVTGELIFAITELVEDRVVYPSLADAFYLPGLMLLTPAIVVGFRRADGPRLSRAALDASAIVLVGAYVGYTVVVAPIAVDGTTLAWLVSAAYPLLGLAALMVLCSMVFTGNRSVPLSTTIVAAGTLVAVLPNTVFTYLVAKDAYVIGGLTDLGWQIQASLYCLGAVIAIRIDERHLVPRPSRRDPGLPIMLAGLIACLAVFVVSTWNGSRAVAPLVLVGYAVAAVVLRLYLTSRDLHEALDRQEALALSDPLTGLRNRRFFEEVLRLELGRARRDGSRVGLLIVDLDRFKAVNDTHGHAAGDAVLQAAARRLTDAVRNHDVVARMGGEEFVLLLPDADLDEVEAAGERCRTALGDEPFALPGGGAITVTASAGGASWPGSDDLLLDADEALYEAKDAGRDRVVLAA